MVAVAVAAPLAAASATGPSLTIEKLADEWQYTRYRMKTQSNEGVPAPGVLVVMELRERDDLTSWVSPPSPRTDDQGTAEFVIHREFFSAIRAFATIDGRSLVAYLEI